MKNSKLSFFLSFFLICYSTNKIFAQCLTKATTAGSRVSTQSCQTFTIRVYIHRLRGTTKLGYTAANSSNSVDINSVIMQNLRDSYNSFGISFKLMGSRDWNAPSIVDSGVPANVENIPSLTSTNGKVAGCINIYVLPKDFTLTEGFGKANGIISDFIFLAGTRPVTACSGGNNPDTYIVPESRTVAHEMGHCFGLDHTFGTPDIGVFDDGFTDTPTDKVQNNRCVNPNTCQFVPNCTSCNVSSNVTTDMTNFMSYTVAKCMRNFSVEQLDKIRFNLNNNSLLMNVVDSKSGLATGPDLSRITLQTNAPVYSVTSVPVGTHYLFTYLDPNLLLSNINWTKTAGNSNSWGVSSTKNTNAWFTLASGQGITFQISAQDQCATSYRTLTFTAQSSFRIYSSPVLSSTITMDFDNVDFSEALPQSIGIYNAQNGKEDKLIDVKELFDKGYFKNNNKLDIDIKKIEKGKKILRFIYAKGSENGKAVGQEIKTENIIITD